MHATVIRMIFKLELDFIDYLLYGYAFCSARMNVAPAEPLVWT